jgi:predicted MFS family arabinose efflux permease
MLCGVCAFLGLHAPQPLLPLLKKEFGVSTATISLVISISTTAIALAAPLAGIAADRFGRRQTIVPSAILISLPAALGAISHSLSQLFFWRIFQGVFTPGVSTPAVAYVSEEWEHGAGPAMSAFVAGSVIGGFAGRMLTALVASVSSWRVAFFTLAALNLIGGLLIWRWLPPGRAVHHHHQPGQAWKDIPLHLKNIRLLVIYLAGFCVMTTVMGAFTYVNFYLASPPHSWSTRALGYLFFAYLFAAGITQLTGKLPDRYGYRRTLIIALFIAMAGILITLIPSIPAVIIGLGICASGVFIAQSAANGSVGKATTQGRAAAVGLYVTAYYIGGSFGASAPGYLFHNSGNPYENWRDCVLLIVAVQIVTISVIARAWRQEITGPLNPASDPDLAEMGTAAAE